MRKGGDRVEYKDRRDRKTVVQCCKTREDGGYCSQQKMKTMQNNGRKEEVPKHEKSLAMCTHFKIMILSADHFDLLWVKRDSSASFLSCVN